MLKLITTSWDDGHPKDFMISELLAKYDLRGTFYVPRQNPENVVMTAEEICLLATNNEIGGHTLNHVRLTGQNLQTIQAEVKGCHTWLHQLLGTAPVSFCYPLGAYNAQVTACVKKAGFKVARTTQLLSVNQVRSHLLLPTTLQMYQHSRFTYFKHLFKRLQSANFFLWMKSAATADILKLTDFYINYINDHGGCFHLWGHSWEIEKFQLWNKLEIIFHHISNIQGFSYVANKDLITTTKAT